MSDAPGAGAAAVASQLLDFFHEPTRFRPAWIHGERPLPEGHVVLKFALGRFSPGWKRDLSRHDKETLVEAARAFVRQVCLWERATHYQVLCLDPGASPESVRENYRLLMALLHPDRQEDSARPEWPTGHAQRVNEAYAVLSDAAQREDYDEAAQRAHPPLREPELEVAAIRRVRARPSPRYLRSFAVVGAVIIALFVVQAWWVNDTPRHYALLEQPASFQSSAQWMRDAISDGLPRFLGARPISFETLQLLDVPKAPRRLAAWVPASETRASPAASGGPPTSGSTRIEAAAPESVAPRSSVPIPATPPPSPVAAPRAPTSMVLAQANAAPAPEPAASPAATQEIELLVARLVSYYEQGDADALMGLFASGEPGLWKGYRTRGSYTDFFRATRERRLRMNRLEWQTSADSARARGEATLVADYNDGRGHLERTVPVELDIALRGGRARLTRLSLFPETN